MNQNKEIWVLTVKTSLPHTCSTYGDLKIKTNAFENFESARNAFRDLMKKLAFSKNAMFDGKGNITYFKNYINETCYENDYEDEDEDNEYYEGGSLDRKRLEKIQTALKTAFSGKDTPLDIKDGFYTDYMVCVKVKGNSICFDGDDDGPCNGYCPILATNMFSMEKEKDYYLYIDDRFGQNGDTAELYIDLRKAELY